MGHDIHFLERLSRIEAEDESLALSLYQDPELVRTILEFADFPDGASRIALALQHKPNGPHVIVARDGAFVTCLGAGMSTGAHPVMPRQQLEGTRVHAEKVRGALHLAESIIGNKDHAARPLLGRFARVGDQATVEDYELMTKFLPIIGGDLFRGLGWQHASLMDNFTMARHLTKLKKVTRSSDLELLKQSYFGLWAFGHTLIIIASDPQLFADGPPQVMKVFNPMQMALELRSTPLVCRGLWAASRFAALNFEFRREELGEGRNADELGTAVSLSAAGCHNPSLRDEVRRLLERVRGIAPEGMHSALLKYRERLLSDCISHLEPGVDVSELFLDYRQAISEAMTERGHGDDLDLLSDAFARWSLVSREWPYDVHGAHQLQVFLPLIVSFEGSDFFLERGRDVLHRPKEVPFDAMLAILRQDALWRRQEPLTRPSTPGRNEPCSCGSGKKYKACCAHKESREGVVFRRKPVRRSKVEARVGSRRPTGAV